MAGWGSEEGSLAVRVGAVCTEPRPTSACHSAAHLLLGRTEPRAQGGGGGAGGHAAPSARPGPPRTHVGSSQEDESNKKQAPRPRDPGADNFKVFDKFDKVGGVASQGC